MTTPTLRMPLPVGPFLLQPMLWFSGLFLLVDLSGFDLWLANTWFALEGQQWLLKDSFVASTLIHKGGRLLTQLGMLSLVIWFLIRCWQNKSLPTQDFSRVHNRYLGLLILSMLLSIGTVSVLKRFLPMDCPWDLSLFGGNMPLLSLWQARPAELPLTQCFPAGHAGSGYAWLALYFYLMAVRPCYQRLGLALGIGLGLVFGLAQQLRGAHFLSHDIASAAICYLIPALLFGKYCRFHTYQSLQIHTVL